MLLVPRQFKISIGGVDHTDCVLSFDGGDDKLSFGSGLIVFRGTIVLGRALEFETLDDRKNKRWNRGTPIAVAIADDSQVMRPSPRGGALFVLTSLYNFDDRSLSLEVGDSFALLSIREGSEDKTGVCLGSAESKTAVINRLLTAAGAPALIDSVPGSLSKGSPKFVQGSYIEQAGAIANGSACFLWVDSQNRVRSSESEIAIDVPQLTIDLTRQAANYKRLPGESPAAWFVVNSSTETTTDSKYGFEFSSESIGPIAVAGVPLIGEIIVRREWQKESLSGNKRFVETKIWEPVGAIIPLQSGRANLVLSHNKLEIFEYESAAPTTGTSSSDKCQTGNQGRLKKRTLTNYRPLGAVLDRVIQTAPKIWQPTGLEFPILALREIEEFDYGAGTTISTFKAIDLESQNVADNNNIPPEDPTTKKEAQSPTIIHTLKRWEPAGAIAPEDFEWNSLIPMWIAGASTLTQSYELIKQWTEPREDEWIAIERERISFNRANPEAAADNRERIKKAKSSTYPKDLFCIPLLVRNDRRISATGNTQPPAPDTIPPAFTTRSIPKKHKYKTPIDTDFPFRQKTQEFNVEHLSIDGVVLAERWAKIAWGRFKGISIQSAFDQHWWDYSPLCRIDVLEPLIGITGDSIDRSAYIADGFAIAIAEGECVIGFDGIFLGFLKESRVIPPYVTVSFSEPETTESALIKSSFVVDPAPITSTGTARSVEFGIANGTINPVRNFRVRPLSNIIREAPGTETGTTILNPATGYREAYKMIADWSGPNADRPDLYANGVPIARYEISLRKDNGLWSQPISQSIETFKIEEQLIPIPGISFVSTGITPYGYVGPGTYEVKVRAISLNGGWSEAITSQQFPSPATSIAIANPNSGFPIPINESIVLYATIGETSPAIVVAPGFPGVTAVVVAWDITGDGSIEQNSDGSCTFISGSVADVPAIITAAIVGTSLKDSVEIRPTAQQQAYSITSIELFGFIDPTLGSNIQSPMTISPTSIGSSQFRARIGSTSRFVPYDIEICSIIRGSGTFPADLDLRWSIASGPGSIYAEYYSPAYSSGERIRFIPGLPGITVLRASAPNGRSATYTVDHKPVSITGIQFSLPSGLVWSVGDEFTVDAIVHGAGAFDGSVEWSVVSGNDWMDPNISIVTIGNTATIKILNGSIVGENIVLRSRSLVNQSVQSDFTLIAKSKILSLSVIPSKSETFPGDTISASGYLVGVGRGTGPETIGTQSFLWSATGVELLITPTGTHSTITVGNSMEDVQLIASFGSFSGTTTILNSGIPPNMAVSAIAGYSVSTVGTIENMGDYGSLNDLSNTTGVAIVGDINN